MCKSTRAPRATAKIVDGKRLCCVCDAKLHGRKDKVFCNYICKNEYHRENRVHANQAGAANIKKQHWNYHILCYLMGDNISKFSIHRMELVRLGFDFETVTGYEINKFGFKLQLFEFSWYVTKNQQVMVYRDPDFVPISPYVYKRWQRHLADKSLAAS